MNAMMQAVRGEYKGTGRTKAEGKDIGPKLPFGIVLLVFIVIIIVDEPTPTERAAARLRLQRMGWPVYRRLWRRQQRRRMVERK